MKAIIIEKRGGPEVLQIQEVPDPVLVPGHVIIKVLASGLNPIDAKVRALDLPFAPKTPAIPHCDAAGVISAVAEDVRHLRIGDEVYCCAGGIAGTPGGALAEYMLADANLVARKPKRLSFQEAAAVPLVGLTAWEALVWKAGIRPGDNVLIHGGTGGVGHFAVQLARAAGARVTATVSSAKKARVAKQLGATTAVNRTKMPPEQYVRELTDGRGFDVVFDTAGGDNLERCIEATRPNGTIVSVAAREEHNLLPMYVKGLSLMNVLMLVPMLTGVGRDRHGAILGKLAALIDAGHLKPLLHKKTFTFATAAKAHALLESGRHTGKIVLQGFHKS